MRRYIPNEAMNASATSTQNRTQTVVFSHGPALCKPYWDTLMSMVPNDTTLAGTNRDSVGCKKDALKVSGYR